jgi:hypothetical protein
LCLTIWLYSFGLLDKAFAHATAAGSEGAHEHRAPELFEADTVLGRYRGLTDQVRMSRTPGRYAPVLVPRGSGPAALLNGLGSTV